MGLKLNGTTGYLRLPQKLVSSFPFSIGMWLAVDVVPAGGAFAISHGLSNADYDATLMLDGNGAQKYARYRNNGGGDSAIVNSSIITVYKLAICVFESTTSRKLFYGTNVPGTSVVAQTDNTTIHDQLVIGANLNNGHSDLFFNGGVAEAFVIPSAIDATQYESLRTDAIKPESLSGCVCFPMTDTSNLTDTTGTYTLTLVGGVTNDTGRAHPIARAAAPTPVSFSGPVPTRNGVVGTAASFANTGFFAGSLTPFVYTSVGTALPSGLTLSSSTGAITGSPTTAGTTSGVIIRATDTGSNVANTNAYSIVIAATNASPTFPGSISNISGTAGSTITPVNVSGQFSDTDALAYTASPAGTAWPSGLVVNSSTGIISGTVAGAGTTTGIKVRATDTASQTVDSNAFNAVIAAAPASPTVDIVYLGQRVALAHGQGVLPLVSVPGKVQFLSKTDLTAAPLANVSKTTNADGTITPWTQAGLTSGVLVTLRWISDADGHEGYYDVTPA